MKAKISIEKPKFTDHRERKTIRKREKDPNPKRVPILISTMVLTKSGAGAITSSEIVSNECTFNPSKFVNPFTALKNSTLGENVRKLSLLQWIEFCQQIDVRSCYWMIPHIAKLEIFQFHQLCKLFQKFNKTIRRDGTYEIWMTCTLHI